VSVKNFHRSARARPPPADTPDESSAVTTSQVTPSIQDFAVSLGAKAADIGGQIGVIDALANWRAAAAVSDAAISDTLNLLRAEVLA
jgi:hypothetical protein